MRRRDAIKSALALAGMPVISAITADTTDLALIVEVDAYLKREQRGDLRKQIQNILGTKSMPILISDRLLKVTIVNADQVRGLNCLD